MIGIGGSFSRAGEASGIECGMAIGSLQSQAYAAATLVLTCCDTCFRGAGHSRPINRKPMGGFEDVPCSFTDCDARSHRVSRRDTRQNRSVGDPQLADAVDLKVAVDDRLVVRPHLGGTALMIEGACRVPYIGLHRRPLEHTWHYLSLHERAKRLCIADLAEQFDGGNGNLDIVRMRQSFP